MDLIVAVIGGTAVGVAVGALGAGGAVLAVPVLVYLLDQDPHAATASSLVVVSGAAVVGLLAHRHSGNVRVRVAVMFAAAGLAGAFAGSLASRAADPDALLLGFSALTGIVAGALIVKEPETKALPIREPGTAERPTPAVQRGTVVFAVSTVVGLSAGLFGVGGGIMVVPALVVGLGFTMPVAAATSLLVVLLNSVAALALQATAGLTVDWSTTTPFAMSAAAGVLMGQRWGGRASSRRMQHAFALFLITIACCMAARSLKGLV